MESRTYLQNLPYLDRLDYVAPMNQEHAWCLAIEKLTGTPVPRRGSLIRVLYSEIGRILNHLLNVTTQAMDVGALTPPLWGFEEREKLMIFYERACGARLHAAYFRPGGVHQDLPEDLIADIATWARAFPPVLDDIETADHREPHLQAAQRRHRGGEPGGVPGARVLRGDGARVGDRLGPPAVAALRVLRRVRLQDPARDERRLLRPLPLPDARDARVDEDRPAGGGEARRLPGRGGADARQDRAAAAGGDEDLDGGPDPPLQALHRGVPRAGGRGLCRGRGAEGGVRGVSGVRRDATSRTR